MTLELNTVVSRNQDGTLTEAALQVPPGKELRDANGVPFATVTDAEDPTDMALADGAILIGSAANLAAAKTLTGDVTMTREGVTTLRAGMLKELVVAGVDEGATPSYTAAGLAVGDELVSVTLFDTGVPATRPVTDFTVGAGAFAVAANPVDNQTNQLLFRWIDRT